MTRPGQPRTRPELDAAARVRRIRRSVAGDIRNARTDAGLSLRRVAKVAGVSASTLRAIEHGDSEPSLEVLSRIGTALGMDLSVRLYPGTGPLIRDHIQAAMIEALLGVLHERWRPSPEVPVHRPVRGVIDLVLDAAEEPLVACEAQSELRRLEQQLRWSRVKADALAGARGRPVSRLLLLRSTRRTRALVAEYAGTVRGAFPASTATAYRALSGVDPWAGDAVVWCTVERGQAHILAGVPRSLEIGR